MPSHPSACFTHRHIPWAAKQDPPWPCLDTRGVLCLQNSHRLIYWAGQEGGAEAQDRLVEQLFKGYFTEEQYINDRDFLLRAAEEAGLPPDGARAVLDDPATWRDEVRAELEHAHALGVSGVPHFTIGGRYSLGGAQDPSTFQRAFELCLQSEPSAAAGSA